MLPSQKQLLEDMAALRNKPYELHHIYPREFEEWFRIKGINIDEYTIPLEIEDHRRIHRGEKGGPWNAAWREYKRGHEEASKAELEKFAGQLIVDFMLYGLVVPYRYRLWKTPPLGSY